MSKFVKSFSMLSKGVAGKLFKSYDIYSERS